MITLVLVLRHSIENHSAFYGVLEEKQKALELFFRVILKGKCNLYSQKNYKGFFIPNYTRNHMITLTIALHKLFRYHQLGWPRKFLNTGKGSFAGYYLFVYPLNSNSFNPLHLNISMHILHIVLHTILSCWQGEFVEQSRASLVVDHFPYSHNLNVWFRGDIVRRN